MHIDRDLLRALALVWASTTELTTAAPARAQELEPRAYANTPVGMNFLIAALGYVTGEILTDASLPLQDAQIDTLLPVLAYARSLEIAGKPAKFDVVAPYSCTDGSAVYNGQPVERDVCGFGDPSAKLSINFYGAPTLTLRELGGYRQNLIIGAGLRVGMPLGDYEPDKLLNVGANRWSIKPEIGVSKALGRVTLEAIAAAAIFTHNDDYFGGHKREQDPVYSLQGHLIYSFRSGAWAAFNATRYRGGRSTIDGVHGKDLQDNTRFGVTLALPVNLRHSVKLNANTGITARAGGDFDTIGIAWQYRWGGGL